MFVLCLVATQQNMETGWVAGLEENKNIEFNLLIVLAYGLLWVRDMNIFLFIFDAGVLVYC